MGSPLIGVSMPAKTAASSFVGEFTRFETGQIAIVAEP
jgi:hypothetical protein